MPAERIAHSTSNRASPLPKVHYKIPRSLPPAFGVDELFDWSLPSGHDFLAGTQQPLPPVFVRRQERYCTPSPLRQRANSLKPKVVPYSAGRGAPSERTTDDTSATNAQSEEKYRVHNGLTPSVPQATSAVPTKPRSAAPVSSPPASVITNSSDLLGRAYTPPPLSSEPSHEMLTQQYQATAQYTYEAVVDKEDSFAGGSQIDGEGGEDDSSKTYVDVDAEPESEDEASSTISSALPDGEGPLQTTSIDTTLRPPRSIKSHEIPPAILESSNPNTMLSSVDPNAPWLGEKEGILTFRKRGNGEKPPPAVWTFSGDGAERHPVKNRSVGDIHFSPGFAGCAGFDYWVCVDHPKRRWAPRIVGQPHPTMNEYVLKGKDGERPPQWVLAKSLQSSNSRKKAIGKQAT